MAPLNEVDLWFGDRMVIFRGKLLEFRINCLKPHVSADAWGISLESIPARAAEPGPMLAREYAMFSTASLPANPDITQRLIDQQCSVQWRGFLQALAAEFAAALPPEDLRALMFRVGVRFAAEHPLPACATLDDLQSSMAAVWDRIGWGGVRLQQTAAQLDIHHDLSPLSAAFGRAMPHGPGASWKGSTRAGSNRLAPPSSAWPSPLLWMPGAASTSSWHADHRGLGFPRYAIGGDP